jgi:sister-chromatid-cohesion protein PDS5
MAARVTVLSRFLPEPVKAQEFLTKFSVHLMRDPALLQGMETIVRPDISCKDCADTTVGRCIVMVAVIFQYLFVDYMYIFV